VFRHAVILCYHRVAERIDDPFQLCVSPERFAAQLRVLRQHAQVVTPDEVLRPHRPSRVVVTFDDGYADNLHSAAPIAAQASIPITVYLTSGVIGDDRGFWWDRLARLIGSAGMTDSQGQRAKHQGLSELRDQLVTMPANRIEASLETLSERFGVPLSSDPDDRPLTHEEVRQLARCENVTIGAHSPFHERLRGLPYETQLQAMITSRMTLQELASSAVNHFAYPFGLPSSFDADSRRAARAAGFTTAVTTVPGSVRPTSDSYALPRRIVLNWSPSRFRVQLLRWGIL
jgi:peptidoglycan/xylan/chitin deacetylase (PgdA/CDA1 family)